MMVENGRDGTASRGGMSVWLARRSQRNAPHPSPAATTISVTGFWSALRPNLLNLWRALPRVASSSRLHRFHGL